MTDFADDATQRWLPFVQAVVAAYELGERLSAEPPAATTPQVLATDHGEHKIGRQAQRGKRLQGAPDARRRPASYTPVCDQASDKADGVPCSRLRILLCSPHPDDEILTGALPLRLRQEAGARVVNLALSLGSAPDRQAARWAELQAACRVVGFECRRFVAPPDFALKEGPNGRAWAAAVDRLAALMAELRPGLVFLPHQEDQHPAHIMAHHLVTAALTACTMADAQTLTTVETEYWRPMAAPNLLVGLAPNDVARLLAALVCHRGEIDRNPYHLSWPARLLDNVRRGSELVADERAGRRPGFLFGELYRVRTWRHGRPEAPSQSRGWLAPDESCDRIA